MQKKLFGEKEYYCVCFTKTLQKTTPWMILLYIAFSIIGYRLDLKNLILLKDLVTFCEHLFFFVFFSNLRLIWGSSRNFYTKKTFWRERKLLWLVHKKLYEKNAVNDFTVYSFFYNRLSLRFEKFNFTEGFGHFLWTFVFFCVFFKFEANLRVQ